MKLSYFGQRAVKVEPELTDVAALTGKTPTPINWLGNEVNRATGGVQVHFRPTEDYQRQMDQYASGTRLEEPDLSPIPASVVTEGEDFLLVFVAGGDDGEDPPMADLTHLRATLVTTLQGLGFVVEGEASAPAPEAVPAPFVFPPSGETFTLPTTPATFVENGGASPRGDPATPFEGGESFPGSEDE